MDKFKGHMNKACGVGGVKCFCCNPFAKRGEQAKLRRLARRKLKREIKKEFQ